MCNKNIIFYVVWWLARKKKVDVCLHFAIVILYTYSVDDFNVEYDMIQPLKQQNDPDISL